MPGPNTPAQSLTVNGLHHLLRHPYYKGIVVHDGGEHPGRHEPLIDPVTWATVQDILAAVTIPVELGGGIRTMENIDAVLALGVPSVAVVDWEDTAAKLDELLETANAG